MLRRLLSNGYFWLLMFSLILVIYHLARPYGYILMREDITYREQNEDEYEYENIKLWTDSENYLEMSHMNLLDPDGLAQLPPWGYAVLIKLYKYVFLNPVFNPPDKLTRADTPLGSRIWEAEPGLWMVYEDPWGYMPVCQLVLHVVSILVFYRGLRELDFPVLAGVLMCLPVMFHDYLDLHMYSLLSDGPGQAFLLFSVSSFFFVLRKPGRPLRWVCLALSVFVSYHTRAAFQFLLVMLPLLTLVLGSYAGGKKCRFAMTSGMLAICWIPYLIYCGWRYHVVGQFSLVACTGIQFFGLCGLLFTDEMLPEVSPENRHLAEALVKRRQSDLAPEKLDSELRRWTRELYFKEEHGWIPPLPHGRPLYEMDYERIEDQYVWLVWWVAWRYEDQRINPWRWERWEGQYRIKRLPDNELPNWNYVPLDNEMMSFAKEFIMKHPDRYLWCVLLGWRQALYVAVARWATLVPLTLFVAMLLLALGLRCYAGPPPIENVASSPGALTARQRFKVLAWTVIALYVLKTQLTAMATAVMEPGWVDGRYIDTAALLLPCLLILGICSLARYSLCILKGTGTQRATAGGQEEDGQASRAQTAPISP